MLKRIKAKKEYILIGIVMVLFVFMSYLSLTSINQLRGTARVVNYTGIVRGATQRLVKKELQGYPDDALINRLNTIVDELITGEGPNDLVALKDSIFQEDMKEVKFNWGKLKEEMIIVRTGGNKDYLFELSEDYFSLVDRAVSSAEIYSEKQVKSSMERILLINGIFVVLLVVGGISFIRSVALRRRADVLGKIAYLDPLTQMPNRASCEQEIGRLTKEAPRKPLAVFMFDMNNLKLANDHLGHQGGDRLIADFARILKMEAEKFGFAGRYGGDEFIAIFPDAAEERAEQYLTKVNEKVIACNLLHVSQVEKISFAVGYVIGEVKDMTLEAMIDEADKRMYVRKRQMKESKEA